MERYQATGVGGVGELFAKSPISQAGELSLSRVLSNDQKTRRWGVYSAKEFFSHVE
jgi:hypothetical protein